MIKFYKSPLFIAALFLIVAGIVYYFQSLTNTQSWGALIATLAFFYGGTAMIIHLVLWLLLKNKATFLILLEFAIIVLTILIATMNKV